MKDSALIIPNPAERSMLICLPFKLTEDRIYYDSQKHAYNKNNVAHKADEVRRALGEVADVFFIKIQGGFVTLHFKRSKPDSKNKQKQLEQALNVCIPGCQIKWLGDSERASCSQPNQGSLSFI